jgi:hypothetical protein
MAQSQVPKQGIGELLDLATLRFHSMANIRRAGMRLKSPLIVIWIEV